MADFALPTRLASLSREPDGTTAGTQPDDAEAEANEQRIARRGHGVRLGTA